MIGFMGKISGLPKAPTVCDWSLDGQMNMLNVKKMTLVILILNPN